MVNPERVQYYADKLLKGEKIDPIIVYDVKDVGRFIEEGHHRYVASQLTGIPVEITVRQGSGPSGLLNWSEVNWKEYINEDQFWGD
ncbi:hypothetical protein [Paenibacillus sp. SI8]|uniref:hypothetical protein n=1 Tax=unclassified Paenibacillus TaxID=185978 RepID=UPI0034654360